MGHLEECRSLAAIKLYSGAIVSVAAMTVAPARAQSMRMVWIVEAADAPREELSLAGGEYILKQRLLPPGLAVLDQTVTVGKNDVVAGTELVKVTAPVPIFCVAEVPRQKMLGASFQPCFMDSDADGDFDAWFKIVSQVNGLLSFSGQVPRRVQPMTETAYKKTAVASMHDRYFVGIERRNWFNIYGNESFTIAFGKEGGSVERLTDFIKFKSKDLPRDVEIMGSRFSALAEVDGRMRIKVHSAMPVQPFGVTATTTYRFY
jgi:hypothetical protein